MGEGWKARTCSSFVFLSGKIVALLVRILLLRHHAGYSFWDGKDEQEQVACLLIRERYLCHHPLGKV